MFETIKPQKSKYFVLTYEYVIPVIIILAVMGGLFVALKTQVFALTEIVCTLDFKECANPAVIAELNKYKGRNLITLNTSVISGRLTAGDFTIRGAQFRKKFPRKLEVEMQSVYPVAAIRVEGVPDEWIIIDAKYRVIDVLKADPNVPTVLVQTPPGIQIGVVIGDRELLTALEFAVKVSGVLPSVVTTSLSGEVITLRFSDSRTAILTTASDMAAQIHTLQAVLTNFTMIKDVTTIDVRYGRPVLK